MINHTYWWQKKHLNLLEMIWKNQCVRIHYSYRSAQGILEASSFHLPFGVCWMSAWSFPSASLLVELLLLTAIPGENKTFPMQTLNSLVGAFPNVNLSCSVRLCPSASLVLQPGKPVVGYTSCALSWYFCFFHFYLISLLFCWELGKAQEATAGVEELDHGNIGDINPVSITSLHRNLQISFGLVHFLRSQVLCQFLSLQTCAKEQNVSIAPPFLLTPPFSFLPLQIRCRFWLLTVRLVADSWPLVAWPLVSFTAASDPQRLPFERLIFFYLIFL